jgi:hypothetical protein
VDARARPAALVIRHGLRAELLRAHADRIDMQSKPGGGSRFYRDLTEIEETP